MKKLTRTNDGIIGGVCGGLGKYLDADPVIFRLAFAGLLVAAGGGLWVYLLMWMVIPKESAS